MFRSLITDSLCQNNLFSNLHQDGIPIYLFACAYVCCRSLFIIFFSFVSFSFVSVVTSDRHPQLNYRRMSQLVIILVYVELICFIFPSHFSCGSFHCSGITSHHCTSSTICFRAAEIFHYGHEFNGSLLTLFCFILVSFFDKNIAL